MVIAIRFQTLPMDETLRSLLPYGTSEHPFEYFYVELNASQMPTLVELHWHRELELAWVISGTVQCTLGAEQFDLHVGEGLFLNSGTFHQFEPDGHVKMVCFDFAPEFIASKTSVIFEKSVLPVLAAACPYIVFRGGQTPVAPEVPLMQQAYACATSDDVRKELQIRNLIGKVWEEIVAQTQQIQRRSGRAEQRKEKLLQARLHKMTAYISEHYGERISLRDIAKAASISHSEALRCFRVGLHTTPVRYLNEYRLRRARERLASTTDTVSRISETVGFESAGYFCRVFKQQYGVSPNAFRKQEEAAG